MAVRFVQVSKISAYCRAVRCSARVSPWSDPFSPVTANLQGLVETCPLQLHLYAGDTQIYGFCRPGDSAHLQSRVTITDCVRWWTWWRRIVDAVQQAAAVSARSSVSCVGWSGLLAPDSRWLEGVGLRCHSTRPMCQIYRYGRMPRELYPAASQFYIKLQH